MLNTLTIPSKFLRQFRANGYLLLPSFVVGDALTNVLANVERFIQEVVPRMPREQVFYEDREDLTSLKQIQHMADHDDWFSSLFHGGSFRAIAEQLLDGPVVPKNLQYFNKPAGIGKATPPHQDGYYFKINPCDAVTMWFALDKVDEQNGCVRYVPGSQHKGMRMHQRTHTLGFSQGIVDYPSPEDKECEVPVFACPGDLLVHDALTIHRADRNMSSNRQRRALGFIYYSERAKEDSKAYAAYQRQLADELKLAGKL